MATIVSCTYRFGEFRLDPGARELWRGGELVELPPLPFDVLTFLVENRERAVSRDELIDAVWQKSYVDEMRVTQLIMRLRRAIGDDSDQPRFIRALTGVGYRWIAETDELPARVPGTAAPPELHAAGRRDPPDADAQAPERLPPLATATTAAPSPAHHAPAAPTVPAIPWFRRWQVFAPLTLAIALLLLAVIYFSAQHGRGAAPLPREPGEAIAVLPLEISAPESADAGWVRLGAMDLIAERLRDAGLPVPPSDSVISALQAVPEQPDAERLSALRHTLGADVLIEGKATRAPDGWTIELAATATDGDRRRVESGPAEVIPAAGRAAELLLAALGEAAPPAGVGENDALSELLQRARAARLALELDTARAILNQAPEPLRDEPELRHELAWVEFRAGDFEAAAAIADDLIEDPAVRTRSRLHGKALMIRGIAAVHNEEGWDFTFGEPYFDAAAATLDEEPWTRDLATALALRALARMDRLRFAAAARDLGRSRALSEVAGDRLGLARIHNHFGVLELYRKRPAEALPHFRAALEIDESFGHVEAQRASLIGQVTAQTQLLHWSDALATGKRLERLEERIRDPGRIRAMGVRRADVLIGMGWHREAEALVADIEGGESDLPPSAQWARYAYQARAQLAWQQGRSQQALNAAARSLEEWPSVTGMEDAQRRAQLGLLHQRASITVGQATPAAETLSAPPREIASREIGEIGPRIEPVERPTVEDDPAYRIAQAEWAAHHGDHRKAERLFLEAAQEAETAAVPATLVLVADAYARWLLTRDRAPEAVSLAGRIADWAEHDYTSALLQVAVYHASGQRDAWTTALRRAQSLAGEREIPPEHLIPPE